MYHVNHAYRLGLWAFCQFTGSTADSYVAIKNIAIMPSGTPKINDLQRELTLLKGLSHQHILTMDSLYVDLVEDSL